MSYNQQYIIFYILLLINYILGDIHIHDPNKTTRQEVNEVLDINLKSYNNNNYDHHENHVSKHTLSNASKIVNKLMIKSKKKLNKNVNTKKDIKKGVIEKKKKVIVRKKKNKVKKKPRRKLSITNHSPSKLKTLKRNIHIKPLNKTKIDSKTLSKHRDAVYRSKHLSPPGVITESLRTDGDIGSGFREAFRSNIREYAEFKKNNRSRREYLLEQKKLIHKWKIQYQVFRNSEAMERQYSWRWDEPPSIPRDKRRIKIDECNALFNRPFGDRITEVNSMLTTNVAFGRAHGGVGTVSIPTAAFASKRILITDDKAGPSRDIGEHFYDGEVGVAVTTRVPDNPYYNTADDSFTARKEFMKEYMNHAMFTVTTTNHVGGKKRTFTVSAPRGYALGLFNNPADTADDTLPRRYRRNNANPSIILRPKLPKHKRITNQVKRMFNDNLRTWMVIASNYALFPWSNYNGGDQVYTIDLERIKEYGYHLLNVLHEWKFGAELKEYSKSMLFLREPRNLVYCGEFIHIVMNLGYNVPLNRQTLKDYGFSKDAIDDIEAKIRNPKQFHWIKTRNNWPPRDKDGNMQRDFPNGLWDPDMLGKGDYINQGANLYLDQVELKFFDDNSLEPLYKIMKVRSIPFTKNGKYHWFYDPSLVLPVWSPHDLLHYSAIHYSGAQDSYVKNRLRPYETDPSYAIMFFQNWLVAAEELVTSYSQSATMEQYKYFLHKLKLPEDVLKIVMKQQLTEADKDVIASGNIEKVRLHLVRKAGLATNDNMAYVRHTPVDMNIELDKISSIEAPRNTTVLSALVLLKRLVATLNSNNATRRFEATAALQYATRETGDGLTSIIPPHMFTYIARNYHDATTRSIYRHLVQFEGVGFALHRSLVKLPISENVRLSNSRSRSRIWTQKKKITDAAYCTSILQHIDSRFTKNRYFPNTTTPTILVVGAGISGLVAAEKIGRAGCNVVLIEARDRAGGRIHTKDEVDFGSNFMGPFDPNRNPAMQTSFVRIHKLRSLERRKKYKRFGVHQPSTHIGNNAARIRSYKADLEKEELRLKNVYKVDYKFEDFMGTCTRDKAGVCRRNMLTGIFESIQLKLENERRKYYRLFFKDRSMSNAIISALRKRRNSMNKRRTRFLAWQKYIFPYGGKSTELSFRNIMTNDNRLRQLMWDQTTFTKYKEGTSLVINQILKDIKRLPNVKILYKHELQNFGWCSKDKQVRSRFGTARFAESYKLNKPIFNAQYCAADVLNDHGKKIQIVYDALVSTLPLGVLKKNLPKLLTHNFRTQLEIKQKASQHLGSGNIEKIVVNLNGTLPKDYRFLNDPEGATLDDVMWVFKEPRRKNAIGIFVGGMLSDNLLSQHSYSRARYLAYRLRIDMKMIKSVEMSNWSKDKYAEGSHPFFKHTGARISDFDDLSEPMRNRVYFAGDWVDRNSYGTVASAAISGYNVARELTTRRSVVRLVRPRIRNSKVRLKSRLWFFPGNSATRDTKGRLKTDPDAVANVLLRAGHLGISDDDYKLTSWSKRIYGFMPVFTKAQKGDLFQNLLFGQERVRGHVGNDLVAFKDAAESPEGFVICNLWLNVYKNHGVCKERTCNIAQAEREYIVSTKHRGSREGIDGLYYAFPQIRSKNVPWWKNWGKNTFNCITYPQDRWGLRFDKLPADRFYNLTPQEIREFATSGIASEFALLMADFKGASCQCWRKGIIRQCEACPKNHQKYCEKDDLGKFIKRLRRLRKKRKERRKNPKNRKKVLERWKKRSERNAKKKEKTTN